MFPELMNQRQRLPGDDVGAPLGPGMFDGLSDQPGPDPEEMEKARQRVLAQKNVKVKDHCVKIFDMHKAEDVKEYAKTMKELVLGTQTLTHKVWANERKLVSTPQGEKWMIYMEWSVFELKVEHTPALGTPRPKKKEKA